MTANPEIYDMRLREIKRLGIAGFVTETNLDLDKIELMDNLAKWGYSWHHWAYKRYGAWTGDNPGLFFYDENGPCQGSMDQCLDTDKVRAYARVYPQAIAGQVRYFHFDPVTRRAIFIYYPDAMVAASTVLAVPGWNYETGFEVSITPAKVVWRQNCCSLAANATISLEVLQDYNGEEITVIITPIS